MSTQQRIEAESHKDPDTLEREIEQKRANIDDIVHALENKLSPGQIFDRVLGYAKGNGGELVANLGDSIKGNPMAALLASIGIAWLVSGKRPARARSAYSYSSGYDAWQGAAHGSRQGRDSDDGMHLKERAGQLKDKAADGAGQLKDKAAELRDGMSDSLHDARERFDDMRDSLGERAHQAGDAVRHTAQSAQQSFEHMLREQPLAVAAIGIAAGALLGALLPNTRQEDEWLGRSSDQLKHRGRELAEQGIERAEHELDAFGEQQQGMSQRSGASPSAGSSTTSDRQPPLGRQGGGIDSGVGARPAAPPPPRSH
jgi:X-X-X-Leu-X-X-Gly heptad repeat protein